jgi:hypothetical protein
MTNKSIDYIGLLKYGYGCIFLGELDKNCLCYDNYLGLGYLFGYLSENEINTKEIHRRSVQKSIKISKDQ